MNNTQVMEHYEEIMRNTIRLHDYYNARRKWYFTKIRTVATDEESISFTDRWIKESKNRMKYIRKMVGLGEIIDIRLVRTAALN